MTEEQIRAIVRDEIEDLMLKQGGILDQTRQVSFNLMRGLAETQAKHMLAAFDGGSTSGMH